MSSACNFLGGKLAISGLRLVDRIIELHSLEIIALKWRNSYVFCVRSLSSTDTGSCQSFSNNTMSRETNRANLFIHSFIQDIFIAALQVHSRNNSYNTNTMSEYHAKAPQATTSGGLAQGPFVAIRAGYEPTALRTKGDKSTNEPPCPTI